MFVTFKKKLASSPPLLVKNPRNNDFFLFSSLFNYLSKYIPIQKPLLRLTNFHCYSWKLYNHFFNTTTAYTAIAQGRQNQIFIRKHIASFLSFLQQLRRHRIHTYAPKLMRVESPDLKSDTAQVVTLISNLATDYIQKRRGQTLLFSFEQYDL